MEAELSRWQLAYETISTLMTVASSDPSSTWRPLLLNYPIDVNAAYLPLMARNHEASDGNGLVTPTHFFIHSVDRSISVMRSPEYTFIPAGNWTLDDSPPREEIESTFCADAMHHSANGTDMVNHNGSTEESQNAFASWRSLISSQEGSPQNRLNVNPDIPNIHFRHEGFRLIRATNEDLRHRHLPNLPREGLHVYSEEADVNSENNGVQRSVFRFGQNVSSNSLNLSLEGNQALVQNVRERDFNYTRLNCFNVCDLFHRLMKNFYTETFFWIYVNTLLHPGSRRILNRIRFLALETGRSLQQTTYDMLSGFLNGYQHSRLPLHSEIDRSLREISVESFRTRYPAEFSAQNAADVERGVHLRQLSLELGAVLNPRQMLRSFGAVVREVTMQTIASPGYQRRGFLPQFHDWSYPTAGQDPFFFPDHSNSQRSYPAHGLPVNPVHPWQTIPPPPPPYPGFLLHFLAMLDQPSVPQVIPDYSEMDDFDTYESLSELTDRLGEAKLSGLSDGDIQRLPVYFYQVTDDTRQSSSIQECCVICLGQFEKGHRLRVLPCGHDYHDTCIDQWLKVNNTCPVCRSRLEPTMLVAATYQ